MSRSLNLKKDNATEEVRKMLPTKPGLEDCLIVSSICVGDIEDIINELSGEEFYIEEYNGCDMDWSDNIVIDDKEFHIWGSARSGSLCFQLKPFVDNEKEFRDFYS